jgi:hypothetical protein
VSIADSSDLEGKVRAAAAAGERLDLRSEPHQEVDARLLCELLTGDARAVRLRSATIVGALDLESAALRCPLELDDCRVGGPIVLQQASASSIRLRKCHLTKLLASQLRSSSDLDLSESEVAGAVKLSGARIGGELRLSGATVNANSRRALDADDLRVEQGAFFDKLTTMGGVYLSRADVGGQLLMDGARLEHREGSALRADRLRAGQGMFCREGFEATGAVRLPRAHISGQLSFVNAILRNPKDEALYAHGIRVDHSLRCDPCVAEGSSDRGAVFLVGADIGGRLALSGARLSNNRGPALEARGARVGLDVLCNDFLAEGEVLLPGARIEGDLSFRCAKLAPRRESDAQRPAEREMNLPANLGPALDLEAAHVGTLDLRLKALPAGTVSLADATLRRLRDKRYDAQKWPATRLDGCRYDALESGPTVEERIQWLHGDPDQLSHFTPRPYEQLAAVYRAHGDEAAARSVGIAKQRRRRETVHGRAKAWSAFLEVTVGYGYRLWLAGVWLVFLVAIGTALFGLFFEHGPDKEPLTPAEPGTEPSFNPVIYTADVLVPVLNLEQEAAWDARGAALWATAAFTIVGWLLTTALLAGIAVRRQ